MLDIVCPKCGKQPLIEVLNVLSGRRYEISCKRCGTVFVVDAGKRDPQEPPAKGTSPKTLPK